MAVKLVRANSDTPNVQNYDDSRLFRYACNGYNGVVKNYGNECGYEISGSNFIVKSGEFVIDGWQGNIDGAGMTIPVVDLGGTQYYVVYAEIDLTVNNNQKAEIKATYNTAYYPDIQKGDDLTTNYSGIARMVLYKFEANSGVISNVEQVFKLIDYGWCKNAENSINATNLTGTIESDVQAVTQATGDNSTKVANTAFVQNSLTAFEENFLKLSSRGRLENFADGAFHSCYRIKIGNIAIIRGSISYAKKANYTLHWGDDFPIIVGLPTAVASLHTANSGVANSIVKVGQITSTSVVIDNTLNVPNYSYTGTADIHYIVIGEVQSGN